MNLKLIIKAKVLFFTAIVLCSAVLLTTLFTLNPKDAKAANPVVDITDNIVMDDYGSIWSADTTQIAIRPINLANNSIFGFEYLNDMHVREDKTNLSTRDHIFINGKSLYDCIEDNRALPSEDRLRGTKFPMDQSNTFNPVCVFYANDHIQVMILTDYIPRNEIEVRLKAGFSYTKNSTDYVVTDDVIFTFHNNSFRKHYDIKWDVEGVVTTDTVPSSTMPVYSGETERIEGDKIYRLTWDKQPAVANGNTTYTGTFVEGVLQYDVSFDGVSQKVDSGTKLTKPADPVKAPTQDKVFVFDGWYNGDEVWDFENDTVTGDLMLTSRFTESQRLYAVTFDGSSLAELAYGEKLTKPADPVKQSDAQYSYTFAGWYSGEVLWDFDTDTVAADMDLKARFDRAVNDYTITVNFEGINGKESVKLKLNYGKVVDFSQFAEKDYSFKIYEGDKEITGLQVTGEQTVKIVYSSTSSSSGTDSGGCLSTTQTAAAAIFVIAIAAFMFIRKRYSVKK